MNRDVVGAGFPLSGYPLGEQTQAGGFGPISRSLGLAAGKWSGNGRMGEGSGDGGEVRVPRSYYQAVLL